MRENATEIVQGVEVYLHVIYTKSVAKQSRNKGEGRKYKESGTICQGEARGTLGKVQEHSPEAWESAAECRNTAQKHGKVRRSTGTQPRSAGAGNTGR